MLFSRSLLASLSIATLLTLSPIVNALQDSDIPSACQSKCKSSVALLNSCGLETDGSNASSDNTNCFCPNMDQSGYDSCTSCIQDHENDDDNDDNNDRRKRNLAVTRRDLLGNLLNIGGTLCTVNGVVSDATSVVGAVTSDAISLVTSVLDGSTSTRTYSPTTTYSSSSSSYRTTDDYEGTTTVYATSTVTARSGARRNFGTGMAGAIGGGAVTVAAGMLIGALLF